MALAKKCDRCKTLYEPKHVTIKGQNTNAVLLIDRNDMNDHYTTRKYIDLCPGCLQSFSFWLNNTDVKKGENDG